MQRQLQALLSSTNVHTLATVLKIAPFLSLSLLRIPPGLVPPLCSPGRKREQGELCPADPAMSSSVGDWRGDPLLQSLVSWRGTLTHDRQGCAPVLSPLESIQLLHT